MTYQVIATFNDVAITPATFAPLRAEVFPLDQRAEVKLGEVISTYAFLYENGQRGQLTVYHSQGRAAICLGGDSDWGDWDHDNNALRLTSGGDTILWYVDEGKIWRWADTEDGAH